MVHPTPRVERLIGRQIDEGRLCLVEPLGHGSGGVVFKAIDTSSPIMSPKEYAVKCMFKAEEGTRFAQFQQREIHFHSSVSAHHNIVSLHRVVHEGRYTFLVMEMCSGGDMFKFLTSRHAYCRRDDLVKKVFVQLIDAVQACHDAGFYHRDIKPENIMCNADGSEVRLGDFGLSTNSKWSTNFGAGTAGYMSPECIGYQNGPPAYSPRSNDVWALGIIFTSMVSGHNPWKRAVMTDDCFRAFIRDPGFLRSMLPISKAASAILQRIFIAPNRRITLPKLRRMVLEADTFFMSDGEIARSNVYVQCAAASYMGLHQSSSEDTNASSLGVLLDIAIGKRHNQQLEGSGAEAKPAVQSLPAVRPEPHIVPLPHPQTNPTSLTGEVATGVASHALVRSPSTRAARLPPPQPMPSVGELLGEGDSASSDAACKKIRRSSSPWGFFRRIIDKIA